MTDESQTFQVVWELPDGSFTKGASVYVSMEEGEAGAADRIHMNTAPSKKYEVKLRVKLPKVAPFQHPCPDVEADDEGYEFDIAAAYQEDSMPSLLLDQAQVRGLAADVKMWAEYDAAIVRDFLDFAYVGEKYDAWKDVVIGKWKKFKLNEEAEDEKRLIQEKKDDECGKKILDDPAQP